jgi:predicted permease
VITRLESETGVAAAAVSDAVPLGTAQPFNAQLRIEGTEDDPQNRPIIDPRVASPGYFPMLGIRVVQGRVFTQFDHREAAPVAVINEAMLPYWNGRSPIDTRISVDNGQTWKRVVGVVGNVRQFGLDRDAIPQLYTPLAQSNGLTGQVLVRINGDERNAGQAIRAAVRGLDPQMPVENVRTLEEIRREYLTRPQLTATLLLIFAGIALIVTLAGIGGVMALSVSNRLKEFGVRLALGASRGRVLGGVLRQGGRLIAVGLICGLGVSMALQGSLRAYLFETVPTDPLVLGLVVAILAVTGLLACVSPAWRATRVAPTVSLQAE